jgi:putative membrane protein
MLHEGHGHGTHSPHAGHGQHAAGADGASGAADSQGSTLDLLAVTGWDAALATVALVALGGLWLTSRRNAAAGWRIPPVSLAGLAVAVLAASSPAGSLVGRGSHLTFMAQLEVLMNVAPVLILLGLAPILRARAGRTLAWKAASPAFGLGAWLLVMYASHLPVVHGLVMGSPGAYALLLLAFLLSGLLFWWPVLVDGGVRPLGKLGYLALAQAGAGVLAAVLIWSPAPLYDHGAAGTVPFGLSPMLDQRLSGAAMMVLDMLVASTVAAWIFVRGLAGAARASAAER